MITTKRWLVALAFVIVLAGTVYWLTTRRYGKTSVEGYRYAAALFSACNQRDEAKLQGMTTMISDSLKRGDIEPAESQWLLEIAEQGLSGNWDVASRDVRQLMEDQQQRAAPVTAP